MKYKSKYLSIKQMGGIDPWEALDTKLLGKIFLRQSPEDLDYREMKFNSSSSEESRYIKNSDLPDNKKGISFATIMNRAAMTQLDLQQYLSNVYEGSKMELGPENDGVRTLLGEVPYMFLLRHRGWSYLANDKVEAVLMQSNPPIILKQLNHPGDDSMKHKKGDPMFYQLPLRNFMYSPATID